MRRTICCFVPVAFVLAGMVLSLSARSSCTINVEPGESIQAAINAAPDGAVICLAEGLWDENVTIDKSVTLQSAGNAVIRSRTESVPVVLIQGTDAANIAVSISGVDMLGFLRSDGDVIRIEGSACATVSSCRLMGNRTGIAILDRAQAAVSDCAIAWSQWGVTIGGEAVATLDRCTLLENGWGIVVGERAMATIRGCELSGGLDGIMLGAAVHVTIEGNVITDQRRYGIFLYEVPCVTTEWTFRGYIAGFGNTGGGNGLGDTCPDDLAFLFSGGGEFDRR